jgi:hypothetical protein
MNFQPTLSWSSGNYENDKIPMKHQWLVTAMAVFTQLETIKCRLFDYDKVIGNFGEMKCIFEHFPTTKKYRIEDLAGL